MTELRHCKSEKWYKIDRNNVLFLPVTATYIYIYIIQSTDV